jgi:uncharacterized protein
METTDGREALCERSAPRLEALRKLILAQGSALVAYSGGVDSTLVLKIAHEQLGAKALGMTAASPAVPPEEVEDATRLARMIGVAHQVVQSRELKNPLYAANPVNRCYHCKTELYTLCEQERRERGLAAVLDGFNADDRRDYRPGHKAAQEHRVLSPLAEVELTKEEIRAWSWHFGLPTWDKPAMPCLASRIPYGTAVTEERLSQVGRAERALRELGLRVFRVRHHGDIARIELDAAEQAPFSDPHLRLEIQKSVQACGYRFVVLDLEPFRSGRLNDQVKLDG